MWQSVVSFIDKVVVSCDVQVKPMGASVSVILRRSLDMKPDLFAVGSVRRVEKFY